MDHTYFNQKKHRSPKTNMKTYIQFLKLIVGNRKKNNTFHILKFYPECYMLITYIFKTNLVSSGRIYDSLMM